MTFLFIIRFYLIRTYKRLIESFTLNFHEHLPPVSSFAVSKLYGRPKVKVYSSFLI